MRRGEVWWARIDGMQPVVLLSGGTDAEFQAMRIVAPATPAEKRGYVVLSGAQAVDAEERQRVIDAAGPGAGAIGIEVRLGAREGLTPDGVVRVALPRAGKVFCTWMLTLAAEHLVERAGVLSPAKLRKLDAAMELAGAGA